jgi:hypothetical protein
VYRGDASPRKSSVWGRMSGQGPPLHEAQGVRGAGQGLGLTSGYGVALPACLERLRPSLPCWHPAASLALPIASVHQGHRSVVPLHPHGICPCLTMSSNHVFGPSTQNPAELPPFPQQTQPGGLVAPFTFLACPNLLQTHWPPGCSLIVPVISVPQDLCTCSTWNSFH